MIYSEIVSQVVQIALQLILAGLGIAVAYVGKRAKPYIDKVREKDKLHIIDTLADRAIKYAEAELTGSPGELKRAFAASYLSEFLQQRGIQISDAEILASLENALHNAGLTGPNKPMSLSMMPMETISSMDPTFLRPYADVPPTPEVSKDV